MSRFAYDFKRLIEDTHHSRLVAMRKGFVRGGMLGAAVGYFLENYNKLPVPWLLTCALAVIGGILAGYHERESAILKHLSKHAAQYDERLLLLLRDGVKPQFTAQEENQIAHIVVNHSTAYEKRLFQSISRELNDKIEHLSRLPTAPDRMANANRN